MIQKRIHILSFLLIPLTTVFAASTLVSAQNNADVCRVTASTWGIKEKAGTGIYEIGKFPVDDIEDGATKSFRYETDDEVFVIEAEIEYGDSKDVERGKPTTINVSLLVKNTKNPESNPGLRAVEAGTTYGHKWGTVFVRKDVVIGDRAYNFQLKCSDGISKTGVKRGDPKWLRKKSVR